MSSEFQNLIKTKNIGSITPTQILDAGSNIFFDLLTNADITAINRTIPAYSHIHAPIYGQPIPLSGETSSVGGSETILSPDSNEVRKVIGGSTANTGAAPVLFNVTLGGVVIYSGIADPAGTTIIAINSDWIVSKNLPLAIAITSGTASDLTTSIASIGLTQ